MCMNKIKKHINLSQSQVSSLVSRQYLVLFCFVCFVVFLKMEKKICARNQLLKLMRVVFWDKLVFFIWPYQRQMQGQIIFISKFTVPYKVFSPFPSNQINISLKNKYFNQDMPVCAYISLMTITQRDFKVQVAALGY